VDAQASVRVTLLNAPYALDRVERRGHGAINHVYAELSEKSEIFVCGLRRSLRAELDTEAVRAGRGAGTW